LTFSVIAAIAGTGEATDDVSTRGISATTCAARSTLVDIYSNTKTPVHQTTLSSIYTTHIQRVCNNFTHKSSRVHTANTLVYVRSTGTVQISI